MESIDTQCKQKTCMQKTCKFALSASITNKDCCRKYYICLIMYQMIMKGGNSALACECVKKTPRNKYMNMNMRRWIIWYLFLH